MCEDTHHRSYNQGLISADRSNKATLLLTIPRSLVKSSAKDLALENLDFDRFSALEHSPLLWHVVTQEAETSIRVRLSRPEKGIVAF